MTEPRHPHRFPKTRKLRRPAEFRRVYDAGSRAGDGFLLVFALPNALGVTRVGFSVSRKHGSAVARNRVKRLLREAFRLEQHRLKPGFDLVVVPRPKTDATLAEYRRSIVDCMRRAVKKLGGVPQEPETPLAGTQQHR